MKKGLVILFASMFFLSGTAMAAPMTWVDYIDFDPNQYVDVLGSVSYTHDITDEGFTPFEDFVYDYNLEIALFDDNSGWNDWWYLDIPESAFINQPGIIGDGAYSFDYANETYGWSFLGLASLNVYGSLDVTITSTGGDFYLDYSTLTAKGCDVAPVPEPATLLLLGSGLAGLAFYRRKRK